MIDGLSRDIEGSESNGYPVYGKGLTMISAPNRAIQIASGGAMPMAGATVNENDFVIADRCGSVFIPAGHIDGVLELCERIAKRQDSMVTTVHGGRAVAAVMHDKEFQAIRQADATQEVDMTETPTKQTRQNKALVALFQGLDTPAVSDAMDKLGLRGQALGIMPLDNYTQPVIGPAFTVKYVPATNPAGIVGDFIDDVVAGDFVVIDNDGRTDCTVWGDIMTQYAGLRGIAATVIDGVCRDVTKALGGGYPMSVLEDVDPRPFSKADLRTPQVDLSRNCVAAVDV